MNLCLSVEKVLPITIWAKSAIHMPCFAVNKHLILQNENLLSLTVRPISFVKIFGPKNNQMVLT